MKASPRWCDVGVLVLAVALASSQTASARDLTQVQHGARGGLKDSLCGRTVGATALLEAVVQMSMSFPIFI